MKTISRPNIAFAGLTAAGKTTHAQILARQLGYQWISATAIILDILGSGANPERIWFTDYKRIQKAREYESVEDELERRVRELANNKDGLLLDTWAMAYIYNGPLIRIWIESDESSRMRKCYISQGQQKLLDLYECRQLVHKKDNHARSEFKRRLQFDLFTDMSRYDAILSNTDLIPEPTDQCAQTGIKIFTPVVHDVAQYLIAQALHTTSKESVGSLQRKYGAMVLHINQQPWSFSQEM